MFDERDDPSFVEKGLFLAGPLICYVDREAFIEECKLSEPVYEGVEVEFRCLEYFGIRFKGYLCAPVLCLSFEVEGGLWYPFFIVLQPDFSVLFYSKVKPFGEGVNYRDADAVQPAGDLVRLALELSTCMEFCQGYLGPCSFFGITRMFTCRDPPAVISNGDTAFHMDRYIYLVTKAREGLVNTVVYYFIYEVVETVNACAPDIHGGPFSDGIKALKDLNVSGTVIVCIIFFFFVCHLFPFYL
ncbi:hypothetical protein BMS3Abin09_00357 [bacterium BMS3Abin09]|nr:hypothetical protein BMS3Abin09_00357 [bacterium BMS3Abin09]